MFRISRSKKKILKKYRKKYRNEFIEVCFLSYKEFN